MKNIQELLSDKTLRSVFLETKLKDYFETAAKLCKRKDMDGFDELWEFTRLDPKDKLYKGFMYPDCESRDEPMEDVTVGEMLRAAQALFRCENTIALEKYEDIDDFHTLKSEMEECGMKITLTIFAPLCEIAMESDSE